MYLTKHLKNEINIDYWCYDQGKKKIEETGVHVTYFTGKIKLVRLLRFLLSSIITTNRNQYDAILIGYNNFAFLFGIFCKSKNKILEVNTGSLHQNVILRSVFNWMVGFNSFFFKKTTVLSIGLRDYLKLSKKNTVIIPLGIRLISKAEKNYTNLRMVYLGSINHRNIFESVLGLVIFLKKHPNATVHYDIIGGSFAEDQIQLESIIKNNNLENIVEYHGRLPDDDLQQILDNATVGICYVPQKPYYEFQPATKLMEYAASGLVVIATDTYENSIMMDEKTGVICQDNPESFAEAIELVNNRLNSYSEITIRSTFEPFFWEKVAENFWIPLLKNNYLRKAI